MLSSVLNSERAVLVNIAIIRAFVKIRAAASAHKELLDRLDKLEQEVGRHDQEIQAILNAIRQLMAPRPQKKKGHRVPAEAKGQGDSHLFGGQVAQHRGLRADIINILINLINNI